MPKLLDLLSALSNSTRVWGVSQDHSVHRHQMSRLWLYSRPPRLISENENSRTHPQMPELRRRELDIPEVISSGLDAILPRDDPSPTREPAEGRSSNGKDNEDKEDNGDKDRKPTSTQKDEGDAQSTQRPKQSTSTSNARTTSSASPSSQARPTNTQSRPSSTSTENTDTTSSVEATITFTSSVSSEPTSSSIESTQDSSRSTSPEVSTIESTTSSTTSPTSTLRATSTSASNASSSAAAPTSTAVAATAAPSKGGISQGGIIVAGVSGAVATLLIILLVFFCVRRRQRNNRVPKLDFDVGRSALHKPLSLSAVGQEKHAFRQLKDLEHDAPIARPPVVANPASVAEQPIRPLVAQHLRDPTPPPLQPPGTYTRQPRHKALNNAGSLRLHQPAREPPPSLPRRPSSSMGFSSPIDEQLVLPRHHSVGRSSSRHSIPPPRFSFQSTADSQLRQPPAFLSQAQPLSQPLTFLPQAQPLPQPYQPYIPFASRYQAPDPIPEEPAYAAQGLGPMPPPAQRTYLPGDRTRSPAPRLPPVLTIQTTFD